MKTLIFAAILSVLYACNFSSEPEINTVIPPNAGSKITTLLFSYDYNSKTVLYSGATPDTIFPAYVNPQPHYQKVDSIWGFEQSENYWKVRINDGMNSHYNVYGSMYNQVFIKKWGL